MYSVLFTMLHDEDLSDEADTFIARLGASWVGSCAGMRSVGLNKPYMAIVKDELVLLTIRNVLNSMYTTRIIGVWCSNGLQQGYKRKVDEDGIVTIVVDDFDIDASGVETDPRHFAFDAALYLDHLSDVIVVNEETSEVISITRPSSMVQVQNWAGWADRDLTDYGFRL